MLKALLWSGSLALIFTVSCTIKHHRESGDSEPVPGEVLLANDAATIEGLRKSIPKEKRLRNDELKELLAMMGQVKDRPERIRSRFDKILRKRRSVHKKNVRKTRDNYTKAEKKKREAFKKKQKSEREAFKSRNTDRQANKDYYTAQDKERREFYNELREKRSDFEAEMRAMSKDYESDIRERRKEFNEELRAYRKRYSDIEKEKRKMKAARRYQGPSRQSVYSAPPPPRYSPEELDEFRVFQQMNKLPGQRLTTEDK